MSEVVSSVVRRLTPSAAGVVGLAVLALSLAGGCTEKAADEGPQDVEKARQDHIQMMQRESGKAPASN